MPRYVPNNMQPIRAFENAHWSNFSPQSSISDLENTNKNLKIRVIELEKKLDKLEKQNIKIKNLFMSLINGNPSNCLIPHIHAQLTDLFNEEKKDKVDKYKFINENE